MVIIPGPNCRVLAVRRDLQESLDWLDYCLGEAQAAMEAVVGATKPPLPGLVELSSELTTFRAKCAGIREPVRWPVGSLDG